MGVIIKESLRQTIVMGSISILGIISTIFFYPKDMNVYGILAYVLNTAGLFLPLVVFGIGAAGIRFFPSVEKTKEAQVSYFLKLGGILLVTSCIFILFFYTFDEALLEFSRNPDKDFSKYFYYILPAALLYGVNAFLSTYLTNYKISALPKGMQAGYKVFIPIVFLLVIFNKIEVDVGIYILFGVLGVAFLGLLMLAIFKLNSFPKVNTIERKNLFNKPFFQFYFWTFLSSLGFSVTSQIDGYMLSNLLDFKSSGGYNMAVNMCVAMTFPIMSVISIASPIISEAWKEDNREEIKDIYYKGSRNLLFIGSAILFSLLLFNDVLQYSIEEWDVLRHLKVVIIILGIGKLIDMVSSVNGVIINYSPWYRYTSLFILFLIVMNVSLNYMLIPIMGLNGAAIATASTLVVFNFLKTMLIWKKLKMNPFDSQTMMYLLSIAAILGIILWLDYKTSDIVSFFVSMILSLGFTAWVLFKTDYAHDTRKNILKLISAFANKLK